VPSVGVRDNFFDLGGDSLLAVRAAALLSRRLGAPVDAEDVFRHPTVEELVRSLGDGGPPDGSSAGPPERPAAGPPAGPPERPTAVSPEWPTARPPAAGPPVCPADPPVAAPQEPTEAKESDPWTGG
jgi:hypothetical protein